MYSRFCQQTFKCAALYNVFYIERIMGLALAFQDDVMGASSELSLSCISLSGELSKGLKA